MKNTKFKFNFLAFSLLLLLLAGFTSCKKDKNEDPAPTLQSKLVGEWEIKSFTIDGTELKGTVVNTSKMEFEAYTGSNGDFEWFIAYTDGSSETQTGDYEVDEADKEITLEANDGNRLKLDFEFDGDDLELSGILDGERYVLKAERD
jgi:Lipocalin-like domain